MAAARIVPEWVEYDNEIKQLLRRVLEQGDAAKEKQTPSQHKKGLVKKNTLFSVSTIFTHFYESTTYLFYLFFGSIWFLFTTVLIFIISVQHFLTYAQ